MRRRALAFFLAGAAVVVCAPGCSQRAREDVRRIEPEGYVFMDAAHGWGHIVTLRIVDWGEPWIHVSAIDDQWRTKTGSIARAEYERLVRELRDLKAFELDSYFREGTFDADIYDIDIRVGSQHNQLRVYCPWIDMGDANVSAVVVSGNSRGSKPHADLVQRLLDESEKDYLRWDVCTYTFNPDRHLVSTVSTDVEDVYFTSEGELLYATMEHPKWAGGTAEETDGCVVWHSADKSSPPRRVPFDVIDYTPLKSLGPLLPRPETAPTVAGQDLPEYDEGEARLLAQWRTVCNGRVGLGVTTGRFRSAWDSGSTWLIAFLVDDRSATWRLHLDDELVNHNQVDVAPDGSRVAWINKGRLFVSDDVGLDCDWLMERLERKLNK